MTMTAHPRSRSMKSIRDDGLLDWALKAL